MPSIHPDYEYDIFISYRQNDNKRDGWVTNFVDALRDELEATLKNPVSIYFDENPHDGLLETHQVDASLAKKLKCLVFIPIISQTYCDQSSFAWEHEFLPFINMAKKDELGMNITLSNGNVTSRVLPVKIHDLDTDDQHTLEAVLDGPLRSIDFIYKESGVNRPLNSDDSEEKNINKTRYKNQLNKVANSLKDIGTSIIKQSDGEIHVPIKKEERPPETKSSKISFYVALSIVLIAFLSFWGYRQFYGAPPAELEDITIAVLAFDDQSPEGDQEYLGDGLASEIIILIGKVEGFQVIGKESSFSFKGKGRTLKEIGETLNVDVIVGGSVVVLDKTTRINVWLNDATTGQQIWSDKYDRQNDELLTIIDKSAQSIAGSLRSELSVEEVNNIKMAYQPLPEAYEYYLRGANIHWDKFINERNNIIYFEQSEKMFINAISIDPNYADAYAGLADLYYSKSWNDNSYSKKRDSIINIGYGINPNSAYLLAIKGASFDIDNIDSAIKYLQRAYDIDSTNTIINTIIADELNAIGLKDISLSISNKILLLDPLNIYVQQRHIAFLMGTGNVEEAREACVKILEMDKNDLSGLFGMFHIALFIDNNNNNAKTYLDKIQKANSDMSKIVQSHMLAMDGKKEALSLVKSKVNYSLLNMKKEALSKIDSISTGNNFSRNYTFLRLRNELAFEFIRDEPEFIEILAKAKIVHEERVAKYGHLFDED